MSEGGEARNHEADEVEAVVRAFLGEERWATMTTERRGQECERMHAALDAVRCAQRRDTDAALAQVQIAQARAARSPQGGLIHQETRREAGVDAPDFSEPLGARSPQGEDHDEREAAYKHGYDIGRIDEKEAAIKAGVFRNGSYVPPQDEAHEDPEREEEMARRDPEIGDRIIVGGPFSGSPGDQESFAWAQEEIDRLRAGISFVRGLCTDRASYSVIDERLGELLDGETK